MIHFEIYRFMKLFSMKFDKLLIGKHGHEKNHFIDFKVFIYQTLKHMTLKSLGRWTLFSSVVKGPHSAVKS